jgi:hypothetical protein
MKFPLPNRQFQGEKSQRRPRGFLFPDLTMANKENHPGAAPIWRLG